MDRQAYMNALRKADAAGNADDARRLASIIRGLDSKPMQPNALAEFAADMGEDPLKAMALGNAWQAEGAPLPEHFAGGVNKGLSHILARPIEGGINKLAQMAGAENTVGTPVADWLEGTQPEATNWLQRGVARTGQTVGGTIPFAGAGLAAAPYMAAADAAVPYAGNAAVQAAKPVASTLQKILGGTGRAVMADPLAAAKSEVAMAGISGAGAGTVAAVAPGHPDAEAIAETVAPGLGAAVKFIPGIWAARKIVPFIKGAFQSAEETAAEAAQAGTLAIRKMLGQGGPQEQAALTEANRLSGNIPGLKPSLGEALHKTTAGPDILATQRSLEAGMTAAERATMRQRERDNVEAVRQYAETHAPGMDEPDAPRAVVDTLTGRVNDLRSGVAAEQSALASQEASAAAKLPEHVTADAGSVLRTREDALFTDARTQVNTAAQALGINNAGNLSVPFSGFQNKIKTDFSPKIFTNRDSVPTAIKDILGVDAKTVSVDDLLRLRGRLGADWRDVMSGPNRNEEMGRQLSILQKEVDNFLTQQLPKTADPQFKAAYDTFRSVYQKEIVDRFKQGAAYKIRQKDGASFHQTTDERVAGLFWKTPTGLKQFETTFRGDGEAAVALTDSVLDDIRQYAVRDGRLNPTLFDNWRRKYGAAVKEMPANTRSAIDDVGETSRALAARAATLKARETAINDTLLAKQLSKISDTGNYDQIVDAALQSPRLMAQVTNRLRGNPDVMKAWQRQLWTKASGGTEAELEAMLQNPAMRQAMSKEHMDALGDIFAASKMVTSAGRMPSRAINMDTYTPIKEQTGSSIDSIASKLWAVANNRVGHVWLVTNLGGGAFRAQSRNAFRRVVQEALYDPNVAKNLAESFRDTSAISPASNKLRTYLFNAGYDLHGDEDEQPE